jgi:hypothetical protein
LVNNPLSQKVERKINMNVAQNMLKTHPVSPQLDTSVLIRCIEECYACAEACNICADACLGEEMVKMLVRCIRLNNDCADICIATGRMLSRLNGPDWGLVRQQVQTLALACRICGHECEKHASEHEHCRVCAESCHRCEESCNQLLQALP